MFSEILRIWNFWDIIPPKEIIQIFEKALIFAKLYLVYNFLDIKDLNYNLIKT